MSVLAWIALGLAAGDGFAMCFGPGLQVNRSCQTGDTAAYNDYFWHD